MWVDGRRGFLMALAKRASIWLSSFVCDGGRVSTIKQGSDELPRRPPCRRPHASPTPISPHPSHISWPHRELHRRPQWDHPHAPATHHTFRGPIGSSTEGPNATARMRPPYPFRHILHTFRGPIGSSTEGRSATARMRPPHPLRHTPALTSLRLVRPAISGAC